MVSALRSNEVSGRRIGCLRAASVLLVALLGWSTWGTSTRAQSTLIFERSDGDIQFFQDVCSYRNPSDPSKAYVEVYYALDRSQMTFIEPPGNPGLWSALWEFRTVVETEVGDQVTWNSWRQISQDTTRNNIEVNQTVFDTYWPPILLNPGVYRFVTTITDLNSRITGNVKVGVREQLVVIADYSTSDLTVSDIEFSTRLGKASSQNYFTKNGLLVIPNPTRTYGINLPLLSIYAEVYGLTEPAAQGEPGRTYTRTISVEGLDVDYRKVLDSVTRDVRARDDLVAITNINVAIFPRGLYRLQVEVVDNTTGERAVRQKEFQIVSEVTAVAPDELNTAIMNEQNIQRFRDQIAYLAGKDQLTAFDALDPDAKRDFLISFWKERDPNPGTPQNEFRMEWLVRFAYANKNFTTPTQPSGWRTDQGRVWIVYGRPDDIVPHPMEAASGKPWVEWNYERMPEVGRATFIFADTGGGFGSYRLIHSNVPGEPQNPNWRQEVGIPPRP